MASRASLVTCLAGLLACAAAAAQPAANDESARIMRLEKFVVPDFPEFLRRTGVGQGTVVVAISHDAEGRPDDMLVVESTDPRFSEAALDAIRQWRFERPVRQPAPTEALVPIVRFFFTSGGVAVTSPGLGDPARPRRGVRADSPVELPNFSHLDTVPKALAQPMPRLPAGEPAAGAVVVKFFVDGEGRARVPVALNAPTPAVATAIEAAVRQWRFEPPRIDGRPAIALETRVFRSGQ